MRWLLCLLVVFAALGTVPLPAGDGVIEINQAAALKGGVTPGDTPGFPVRLTLPGSYMLTGDLVVPDENTHGLQVVSGSVTVDLNGFTISGVTTCSGGGATLACGPLGTGVGVLSSYPGTVVLNGRIQGVGGVGVDGGDHARVERLTVRFSGSDGISLSNNSQVRDCTTLHNQGAGIVTNQNASIVGNMSRGNGDDGIRASSVSNLVRENVARNNAGDGIQADFNSLVIGNVAYQNTGLQLRLDTATGYKDNVLTGGGGTVSGGVSLGTNLCDGDTTCP